MHVFLRGRVEEGKEGASYSVQYWQGTNSFIFMQ